MDKPDASLFPLSLYLCKRLQKLKMQQYLHNIHGMKLYEDAQRHSAIHMGQF
jgi:hypothetical protein